MPSLDELPPEGLEEWTKLGCKFRFCLLRARGEWIREDQIDDPETWDECVVVAMARHGADYALYPLRGRWVLVGGGKDTRDYPSREAAEKMFAIHHD